MPQGTPSKGVITVRALAVAHLLPKLDSCKAASKGIEEKQAPAKGFPHTSGQLDGLQSLLQPIRELTEQMRLVMPIRSELTGALG